MMMNIIRVAKRLYDAVSFAAFFVMVPAALLADTAHWVLRMAGRGSYACCWAARLTFTVTLLTTLGWHLHVLQVAAATPAPVMIRWPVTVAISIGPGFTQMVGAAAQTAFCGGMLVAIVAERVSTYTLVLWSAHPVTTAIWLATAYVLWHHTDDDH